ncbi:MAG: hypothetical protein LCH63_10345 [Candidatus Melainabacteria bacterium]|nr:hypothetical protein [Candidatus Melainabacteria bacterium]
MKKLILSAILSLFAIAPAFAARTALNVVQPKKPDQAVSANSLDVAFTAADVSNGNSFVSTGREYIFAQNSGASPYTVTITSAPDELGRTNDIDAYSLGASEFLCVGPVKQRGWKQSDGKIYINAENTAVKFLIVRVSQ